MLTRVHTGTLSGIEAHGVEVEVSPVRGLPGFDIVGLPEAAVRESRVRVMAALANAGYVLPERRFVVNLAPADRRKNGASFDLAIGLALLAQCGLCAPGLLEDMLVVGELSLDGRVRPTRGLLPQLTGARRRGLTAALVPEDDAARAGLVDGVRIHCTGHLTQAVDFLNGLASLPPPLDLDPPPEPADGLDLTDVRGQGSAKRVLEIAAAGRHHVLMVGPPGSGKTMLARRLPGLLPPPERAEVLEIATIESVAASTTSRAPGRLRPFRAPHHSCSAAALVGGGDPIRPGEVTLAHGGVLFLDELPEFRRDVLEALRPTMESGQAVVVRARDRAVMPADPLLVAAMNPCPCGYAGQRRRVCRCNPDQVSRYRGRISGPLLDRFDLHVALPPVEVSELRNAPRGEATAVVRARVCAARTHAAERQARLPRRGARLLEALAAELEPAALRFLHKSFERLRLSLRAYAKVLCVARTIADLEASNAVTGEHVGEAIQYRLLDRPDAETERLLPRAACADPTPQRA